MNKLKLILAASIAVALTLACTEESGSGNEGEEENQNGDNSGGGGSGNQKTENYTLVSKSTDQFIYAGKPRYFCLPEYGVVPMIDENTVNYSIKNNTLDWSYEQSPEDSLNFKGTSNNLIGTWTRTKNNKEDACGEKTNKLCIQYDYEVCVKESKTEKLCVSYDIDQSCFEKCYDDGCDIRDCEICTSWEPSCEEYKCLDYYESEPYYTCKEGYDITKAVITENTVSITRETCTTEDITEGQEFKGWKYRVIDCNTYELYKGNDKVTIKYKENGTDEISYKGKTEICDPNCNYDDPYESESKVQAACTEASNKYNISGDMTEFYDSFYAILYEGESGSCDKIYEAYAACQKRILPPELTEDDDDFEGKAKAIAKPKFKPLLKKLR